MSRRAKKEILTRIKNLERVEERHDQIFQAASKLIQEKGYHMTTLRDISRETGIGLGNLYDYISSKEDILYLVHEKAVKMVSQELSEERGDAENPVERLKELIEMELDTINKYQDLIMVLYQESHALSKLSIRSVLNSEKAHMERFKKVLNKGIEVGVFKPCNSTLIVHLIKMMIDCWVLKRWDLRGKVSLEEMKQGIIQMVQTGILTREK